MMTNIHWILHVPMKGTLIKRVTLIMVEIEDQCYYLTEGRYYQQQKKGTPLHDMAYMPLESRTIPNSLSCV